MWKPPALRARGHRSFVATLIALVVGPGHADLVAGLCTLDAQPQKGVARNRLAPLRVEHHLAVVGDDHILDEMQRYDVALRVLALAGLHRMQHQDAHVRHIALQRGADLHWFSKGEVYL